MSLNVSQTRLYGSLQELMQAWEKAKSHWDDPVSKEFEKRHLMVLEPKVRHALTAMEKMGEVLQRAKRECG